MKKNKLNKLFIIATEQSGDNIGCSILKELNKYYPSLKIDGVGGELMKPLMRNQLFSIKDFKSIGIVEIIFSISKYINIIYFLV